MEWVIAHHKILFHNHEGFLFETILFDKEFDKDIPVCELCRIEIPNSLMIQKSLCNDIWFSTITTNANIRDLGDLNTFVYIRYKQTLKIFRPEIDAQLLKLVLQRHGLEVTKTMSFDVNDE